MFALNLYIYITEHHCRYFLCSIVGVQLFKKTTKITDDYKVMCYK